MFFPEAERTVCGARPDGPIATAPILHMVNELRRARPIWPVRSLGEERQMNRVIDGDTYETALGSGAWTLEAGNGIAGLAGASVGA